MKVIAVILVGIVMLENARNCRMLREGVKENGGGVKLTLGKIKHWLKQCRRRGNGEEKYYRYQLAAARAIKKRRRVRGGECASRPAVKPSSNLRRPCQANRSALAK